jgi:hypothetical protein
MVESGIHVRGCMCLRRLDLGPTDMKNSKNYVDARSIRGLMGVLFIYVRTAAAPAVSVTGPQKAGVERSER